MSFTKFRSTRWGFFFACLVIGWIGVATYWSAHRLVRSFDSVSESHLAIEQLQKIHELEGDGESSAYRYVITGNVQRLDAYRYARALVERKFKEVEPLLAGHARERKALNKFRSYYDLHEKYLSRMVTARQESGTEAATQWVMAEDDQAIRDGMEDVLGELQRSETRTLKQRAATTNEHSSETTLALVGAAFASIALVAWVFGLLNREKGERHLAESDKGRLETFLRSIVERIPYMVTVKEAGTLRLILVNKAATEWLGRTEDDLLNSNDYDLLPKESAQKRIAEEKEILRKGEPVDIPEERFRRAGREDVILHTQKVVIPDSSGHPAFLLTISEDITKRKEAEQMLELSRDAAVQSERLKSEFIRNMSHEIRTPLSIVIGMTTVLKDSKLDSDQSQIVGKLSNSVNALAKLTKSIFDFSKIEAGTFSLDMQDMSLQQNIEGIVRMLGEQAKVKGVNLVSIIPPTLPEVVVGDAVRLREVVTELLGNAVKFTPKGEVIIRVTEENQTQQQIWLKIEVTDTGIGIEQEAQKHLFQPFRQGDGSPTRKFGGTGLGLALSKRIVELMGGQIGFSSAPNKGSSFWFTVPFTKRDAKGPIDVVSNPSWTKARILVVDENTISRQKLRDQLSSLALANEGVSTGEAALALMQREQKAGRPFPIVLLDLHLPDMEGVELMRAVHSDPALAATTFVALVEGHFDSSAAFPLGFSTWITKPPQREVLMERLSSLIEPRRHPSSHVA